jgi:hypothetical protein
MRNIPSLDDEAGLATRALSNVAAAERARPTRRRATDRGGIDVYKVGDPDFFQMHRRRSHQSNIGKMVCEFILRYDRAIQTISGNPTSCCSQSIFLSATFDGFWITPRFS